MPKDTQYTTACFGRTRGISITAYDWFKEADREASDSVLREIGSQRLLPSEPHILEYKLNKLRGE